RSPRRRNPHSFPTRRSSDLSTLTPTTPPPITTPVTWFLMAAFRLETRSVPLEEQGIPTRNRECLRQQQDAAGLESEGGHEKPRKDRKSTRLNSSHRTTSYAA